MEGIVPNNLEALNGTTTDPLRTQNLGSGNLRVSQYDGELNNVVGMTSLRDLLIAQRYTVWADSLADGIAAQWTQTTANGGTVSNSGGEGLIQTSANASGSSQIVGPTNDYFPGQVAWVNSAIRCGDTGSSGNVRRWGVFTVSGTTPQNGFYYELNGTTLNAVVVNNGVATSVASTAWSRVALAPFTMDTNYHGWEIRFTANAALFYVDNVLRHATSAQPSAITTTLNFPISIQSINSSGATNRLIACRNIGYGRFGFPPRPSIIGYYNTNRNADYATAQTGTALWTPASGKKICITRFFISTNNNTEGLVTLWFGASGDTTFTSGTDQVVYRGTLTPTANDKRFVLQQADIVCNNPDYVLRVTTSTAISITVGVDGFEF